MSKMLNAALTDPTAPLVFIPMDTPPSLDLWARDAVSAIEQSKQQESLVPLLLEWARVETMLPYACGRYADRLDTIVSLVTRPYTTTAPPLEGHAAVTIARAGLLAMAWLDLTGRRLEPELTPPVLNEDPLRVLSKRSFRATRPQDRDQYVAAIRIVLGAVEPGALLRTMASAPEKICLAAGMVWMF
jgi:hypothetical protein